MNFGKKIILPEIKTITDRILVDDESNLWVQTNEKKEENGKTFTVYDVFNKDGYYEAKVWCELCLICQGKNVHNGKRQQDRPSDVEADPSGLER